MSDREKQWADVKVAWSRGNQHELTPESFADLFNWSSIADEAIALMKTSAAARPDLARVAGQMSIQSLTDSDVNRVWAATRDDGDADDLFLSLRSGETPAIRSKFASSILDSFLALKGRQWVRKKLAHWWARGRLLEEEQEAIIRTMINGGITDMATYQRLGAWAARFAEAKLIRSGLITRGSVGASLLIRRKGKQGRRSEIVASRVESLVNHVVLPLDIRDACIDAEEMSRLGLARNGVGPGSSLISMALARAMRQSRYDLSELSELLSRALVATPRTVVEGEPWWSLSLLRLLHLRLVLETSSLSKAVREPEVLLVPDVALYVIGRDAVSYTPELRVHRDAGSRWRARWAESAAEAFACAFLEDSVQLDLASLSRIPESPSGPTPDFMATSVSGEAFVFEVKGRTTWHHHVSERRTAIKQLAKDRRGKSTKWAGDGRAFACSLFAARQGDSRSSLLHVDDPDFAFDALFGEEGELASVRRHYVGVLESAQLFDVADHLASRRLAEPRARPRETFEVPERDRFDDRGRFVGSYLPLAEWAGQLQHPEPDVLRDLRLFVGVEESVFRRLERGEVPARRRAAPVEQAAEREPYSLGSHTGVLSGENGFSRGVYSVLSDGAFLSVEFA